MCRLASLALRFHLGFLDLDFLVMTLGLLDPYLGHRGLFSQFGVFPMLCIYLIPLFLSCPPFPFLVLALSRLLPPCRSLYHVDLPFASCG